MKLGFGHSWSAGAGWGAGQGACYTPWMHRSQLWGSQAAGERKVGSPLGTCTHSSTTSLPTYSHLWVFLGVGGLLRTR